MIKPSIGRIVHYVLTDSDAKMVNRRRRDASAHMPEHKEAATGVALHVGNPATAGDVYPLIITRAWGDTEQSAVNGQVLLDGNDNLWVTSVSQVDDEHPIGTQRRWFTPPRV